MEFYLATKENENEILFAGKWMEQENIILSEISQTQKAKSCMFPHMWNIDLMQMQQCYETLFTLRRHHSQEG
jgi:hypothetical protein